MENLINVTFGIVIANFIYLYTRDKDSSDTPYHLSVKFWIIDNWARILISALISYSIAGFLEFNDLLPNEAFAIWVTIGGSVDAAIHFFKKYTGFLTRKNINIKGRKYRRS